MDGIIECPNSGSAEYLDDSTGSAYWDQYPSSVPMSSGGFSSNTYDPSQYYAPFNPSWHALDQPESPPGSEQSSYGKAPSSRTSYNDAEGDESLAESSSPESLFFDMRETQSPSINLLGMAAHIEPVECDSTIDWSTSMLQMSSSGTSLANFTSPEIHRCTEGCSKNFGRSYDLRRHIEEQHRCPHPDCKELRLATANEKKEHKREHSDMGFRCGICALAGLPPKSLSRKEKLRKHLRDIHMIPDDLDFLEFQCLQASCYLGKACGGIYFTSRQELDKHTGYQHAAKPSQDTYTDGKSYRAITSKPLIETVGVGNVAKRPRDLDVEPDAKRGKVKTSNQDIMIPQIDTTRSKTRSPVVPQGDSYATSSHIQNAVEESLGLSVIDLQALTKQQRWESVLSELSNLHLSPTFDSKKAAIILRGSCSVAEMEKGKTLMADLINQAKSMGLQDDEIDISLYTKSRKGFHQQVSVHPQPAIYALDPKEDADTLALWNSQLLRRFPDIVREALIEGSYSVALVRQSGPDGSQPVIRFRSSGNQGETSRQIIQENVARICTDNDHSILDIQFTEGSLVRLAGSSSISVMNDPSNDQKFPHQRRPWGKPGMGASIGLSQCPHVSATLGGYISVDGRIYMLTVDHFISECTSCVVDTKLRSPSISDMNDVRRHLKSKLKDLGLKISRSAPDEIPLGKVAELLFPEDVDEELEQYKRFHRELDDKETGFALGVIRYRCGGGMLPLRPSSNPRLAGVLHHMDWSVSEITAKHRKGKNFHRHGRVAKPGTADLAQEVMKPEGSGDPCAMIGDMAGGEGVFYVGTTSGLREGCINPALIQYGDEYGVSHEWSMVVPHCEALKDSDFQGDSGAWIISNDNKLLGLLWGWDNGNLLFTPIQDVFADITQKMNCHKIELPDDFSGSRSERSGSLLCRTNPVEVDQDAPEPIQGESTDNDEPVLVSPSMLSPFSILQSRRSSSASSISNYSMSSTPSLLSSGSSFSFFDEPGAMTISSKSPSHCLTNDESVPTMLPFRPKSRSLPTCAMSEASALDWVCIRREDATEEMFASPLGVREIKHGKCETSMA